jgi:hypothetical protein
VVGKYVSGAESGLLDGRDSQVIADAGAAPGIDVNANVWWCEARRVRRQAVGRHRSEPGSPRSVNLIRP